MNRKLFWEAFRFPVLVLLLIIMAVLSEEALRLPLPFPAALIPLAVGGGYVCWDAFADLWREKEVSTELLVVLALVGTVFTGEYMEGAEVAFMMLLGEGLEDFAMKRARNAVDELFAAMPEQEQNSGRQLFSQEGDLQRLTDRFARFFLPVILLICAVVFIRTWDIHRVMSILVIACPCSLVLSSPAAVLASVENAARHGIFAARPDDREAAAYAQALAARTRRVIWENILLFAFLMNFVGIALSGLGHLEMLHGAVLHNLATVCVLVNSMRLLR